jgi:hypothetical protein
MNGPFLHFAKYGVQTTFVFCLEDGSTTDCYVGTDVVAADSTISKDGGASAATTNAVTTTNSPFFKITLTATEMQAERILVRINDASAAVFKDAVLLVITKLNLGQVSVDATQIGGNTNAIEATGVGTGKGANLTGASAAYGHNLMDQLEGTEPAGAPADNASFKAIFQALKRRFIGKRTQTATTFTQYKDDAATSCWTAAVSDDGSTQSVGKGA